MTNLKPVTEGFNKFCGPAVLSILTGKSTDECANVISRINGHYRVTGVLLTDLLMAANRLGFDNKLVYADSGSLYRTLTQLVATDGMYIVTLPTHFVCIEVKEKKVYFCDNHTKEPIPAASSARLMTQVVSVHKVTERPKPPEPVKTEAEILREMLLKARRQFEKDVEDVAVEIVVMAKQISQALGEVSVDELKTSMIREFEIKLRNRDVS